VPLGVWAAVRRNRFVDYLVRVGSLAGLSFPAFVSAIILLFLFAIELHWFPAISARKGSLQAWAQSITLPAISLGLTTAAYITRVTRSAMLEVLSEDFVRTARAKAALAAREDAGSPTSGEYGHKGQPYPDDASEHCITSLKERRDHQRV
jgi:peptide/nickel transport system permease protein